jgi:hypothetical protein
MNAAADHVKVGGSWPSRTIRPSLLSDPCPLSRVKKFLGHKSQPGVDFSATRAGRPSATTAINFSRGYFMEGLLVAALKAYIAPPDKVAVLHDDPWEAYSIIGCSPTLEFNVEGFLVHDEMRLPMKMQAHPDVVANYCGEIELIQMKCPSVFKMDRIDKNGDKEFDSYVMQLAAEMYIGRLAGYDIKRTHLLMTTFEGYAFGKRGDGLRTICRTWEWDDDMAPMVEAVAEEILKDVAKAENENIWPEPFPEDAAKKFPCSFCNFARVGTSGLIGCTDHKAYAAS